MSELIFPALNLAVLLGILFYFLKSPTKLYFIERHTRIAKDIHEVRNLLENARVQFDDFSSKIKALDSEIELMRSYSKQELDASRSKIISNANEQASRLIADTKRSADEMVKNMTTELVRVVGLKIVESAEATLKEKITEDDQLNIRTQVSKNLENLT